MIFGEGIINKNGIIKRNINSIKEIIREYKYNFKLFGSRARGDYKNSSDIDIAIFRDATEEDEYKIKNQFDLLDTPYTRLSICK